MLRKANESVSLRLSKTDNHTLNRLRPRFIGEADKTCVTSILMKRV